MLLVPNVDGSPIRVEVTLRDRIERKTMYCPNCGLCQSNPRAVSTSKWVGSNSIGTTKLHIFNIYTVFGLSDFRENGKHTEEKWVENSVFHYLAKEGKY